MNFISSAIESVLATFNITSTPASTSTNSAVCVSPNPTSTIIQISLLLRTCLPADLVPIILDFAELWVPLLTSISINSDRVGERQSPKLQVALNLEQHIPYGSVRRIRFTTISRDQGWSDSTDEHGTYCGSYTWFEAGIRGLPRDKGDSSLERADLVQLATLGDVDCQHRNALDQEHILQCQPQVDFYKYGSRRLATNIHAGNDFKEHVVVWDLRDEDEHVRKMLKEIRKGCRIEVAAYACFRGWVNYVQSVQIELECAVVRKL